MVEKKVRFKAYTYLMVYTDTDKISHVQPVDIANLPENEKKILSSVIDALLK